MEHPKKDHEKLVGIIIYDVDSFEQGRKVIDSMKNCPNLLMSGFENNKVYSIYLVPQTKEWWLKWPEENKDNLAVNHVTTIVWDSIIFPEKITFGQNKEKYPEPPCGTDCSNCQLKTRFNCEGCPAVE
ncbi:MAG: hypothetical protein GF308_12640 [Candidatus Heimdallarchaeota archaeon]|nr:hypothetical protein [Candidatus Heimdallarchaeota archaeon]